MHAVLIIFIMLYIASLVFIYLMMGNLYLLTTFHTISPSPSLPLVTKNIICFSMSFLDYLLVWASQAVLVVKNPSAKAGDIKDAGWIPGSGRSPGGGHGNPL